MPQNIKEFSIIQKKLSMLLKDSNLVTLHPLIEAVHRYSIAEPPPYAKEVFKLLIEIIEQMGNEIMKGKPIDELLERAVSGDYVQPNWKVHDVYQAHGNIIQFILGSYRNNIKKDEPEQPFLLPTVLLVMNDSEVQELIDGTAFNGHPQKLRDDFERLREFLTNNGVLDWAKRYNKSPKDWQPFGSDNSDNSIKDLMKHALSLVSGYKKPLVPNFIDIRDINQEKNRSKLNKLRSVGCIVILDVISMRHPIIQNEFNLSLLDAFPNTLVASIGPTHAVLEFMQEMIVVVKRHIDTEFNRRYRIDRDSKCIKATELIDIERWVKDQIAILLPEDIKPEREGRKHWFKGGELE